MKSFWKEAREVYHNMCSAAFWLLAAGMVLGCLLLVLALLIPHTDYMAGDPYGRMKLTQNLWQASWCCMILGILTGGATDLITKYRQKKKE